MSNESLRTISKILTGVMVFLVLVVGVCVLLVVKGDKAKKPDSSERVQDTQTEQVETGLADATTFLPDNCGLYQKLPELSFTGPDGADMSLADFKGAPVIITFWASWCPDCHEQMKIMNDCMKMAEEQGCSYILMDKLDNDKETKELAASYLRENGIQSETCFDEDLKIYQQLGMHNVPTTFFIDGEGILKAVYGKQITELPVFEAYMNNMLQGSDAATKSFVMAQMSENGAVHNEYTANDSQKTLKSDILSESQGIMLEYAVNKEDKELFDQVFDYTRQNMMAAGLVTWCIKDGKPGNVNALIDDLRIYKALCRADALWGGYGDFIATYQENLKKYGLSDGSYIDFYDFHAKQPADRFTLCYADLEAMQELSGTDEKFERAYEKVLAIVKNGKISDEFPLYYSWYQYSDSTYQETELNTSEAMVTLLHLARAEELSEDSIQWIRDTMNGDGIKARYDVKGNVVKGYNFESTATYAIVAMIGKETGDTQMMQKALYKMEQMRINDTSLIYNGAFGNSDGTGITSFDQLVPMLAYYYCAQR